MREGNFLGAIERIVQRKRQVYIISIAVLAKKLFQNDHEIDTVNILSSELLQLLSCPCPSNDIYHKCLVVHFIRHRDVYDLHMSEIPVTSTI